jgi:hypothetical protein
VGSCQLLAARVRLGGKRGPWEPEKPLTAKIAKNYREVREVKTLAQEARQQEMMVNFFASFART